MAFDFKFPDVGEGTTEGTLVKWLVKEGDPVKADQAIAEIETDKAVVEIPSPRAGIILKLFGKVGEVIKVGNVLATIGEQGEANIPTTAPAKETPPALPEKTNSNVTKPVSKNTAQVTPSTQTTTPIPTSAKTSVLAAPSTRHLARELGIDIQTVKGTGPAGRIMDEDVQNAAAALRAGGKQSSAPVETPVSARPASSMTVDDMLASHPTAPEDSIHETSAGTHVVSPLAHTEATQQGWKPEGSEERVPLKGLRKVISDRMVKSMFTAVQVTHMDECDVTALVKLRAKEKPKLEKQGIKLTYLPFFVKASMAALKNHPWMNASIDDVSQEAVYKHYYHAGVAVDTEDGLIVPVLRNVDKKSIIELAKEMQEVAQKTRERRISPADLKGSTFTITNVGTLGGTYSTPVINWPEVAILGIGKIEERPVVRDGKIVIRHMVRLSLTFDHRLVDGAQAVRYLNEVMEHVEDPGLFLVDVI